MADEHLQQAASELAYVAELRREGKFDDGGFRRQVVAIGSALVHAVLHLGECVGERERGTYHE